MSRFVWSRADAGRGMGQDSWFGAFVVALAARLAQADTRPDVVSQPAAKFTKNATPVCSAIPSRLEQHFSNVRQQFAQVAGESGGLRAVVGAMVVGQREGRIRRGTICPSRHIGRSEAREKPRMPTSGALTMGENPVPQCRPGWRW